MADSLPDFNDKRRLLAHAVVAVSTVQVEAKSAGSPASGREELVLYNDSNNTVFWGLTGVSASGPTKGLPIFKGTYATIPAPDDSNIYLIAASGSNNIIVFEFGD